MRSFLASLGAIANVVSLTTACDSCYGPSDVQMVRNVRRMQPDAKPALSLPKAPLDWGQLNFLHTTDTHGWLEGHLKENNYGADWGDYSAFVKHMRAKAKALDVDLLLVDTGDLHDGAGLSDATSPNGAISNLIFENVQYDLMTIGNHELYLSDIAYETATQFSKFYGERYLTSNVQIFNNATGQYEYIGQKFRYFTTDHGVRIMSFGVLFDFDGNSNASKVIPAVELVQQSWYQNALAQHDVIDLFVIIGHNPVRPTDSSSTFGTIYESIRNVTGETPILFLGGHSHIRDFVVLDDKTVGIESGRYCETLGWMSMNGLHAGNATERPAGQPTPSRPAVATPTSNSTSSKTGSAPASSTSQSKNHYRYSRRYIDWNRASLEYHSTNSSFNTTQGNTITSEIFTNRQKLNLTNLIGCAPQTYCMSCAPQDSPDSIFSLLPVALATTIINETRKDIPRLIIINSGSIRFDLVGGPFTLDDTYIVSPFTDGFQFIPDVPYGFAKEVLPILNAGPSQKKRSQEYEASFSLTERAMQDTCFDPAPGMSMGELRRRTEVVTQGYTTTDDFGTDGDDTIHSSIPFFEVDNDIQGNASFPTNGSEPATVDLIFLDFIVDNVIEALASAGASNYTESDASYYLPKDVYDTNTYLTMYAKQAWGGNRTCATSIVD